ncbi:MAG: hypothetical protein LBT87_00970 [Treponema sp.]|jgi:uncharacterized protein YneR|nr:hypothetical protein [Treponema sp.]
MTIPPKAAVSRQDENVNYFILPGDTLYFDGTDYTVLPKGDVMELPTVYFEKELR